MSLSRLPGPGKEAIERHRLALIERIRRNFWLKFISLATAVMLYIYVQAERNPMVTRPFTTPVLVEHKPEDVDVQGDTQKIKVNVSGPRAIMDLLKDGDVRITADFTGTPVDRVAPQKLRCRYDFVGSAAEHRTEISLDPPEPTRVPVMVYPQRSTAVNVSVHYLRDAPVGYRYSSAEVSPPRVRVSGRLDRVNRVERVVVNAVGGEAGASIEGDFLVTALDSHDNAVGDVTLTPNHVHVTIPLGIEPYSKIVSVSPDIRDSPAAGIVLYDIVVAPTQVRVTGRPETVDRISTILTEPLSIRSRTEDVGVDAPLVAPAGVAIHDLDGKPLHRVHVHIALRRTAPTPPPPAVQTGPDAASPPPPKP